MGTATRCFIAAACLAVAGAAPSFAARAGANYPDSRLAPTPTYMFLISASPNSEHFTCFAPSMSRAKS
jgi:hypothetical protein